MKRSSADESNNPKDGTTYERVIYVCNQDDVWLTTEIPTSKQREQATILYKNWRGETAERHIIPLRVWFGGTEWHKESQWLLRAKDMDKDAERDFALKDILEWK